MKNFLFSFLLVGIILVGFYLLIGSVLAQTTTPTTSTISSTTTVAPVPAIPVSSAETSPAVPTVPKFKIPIGCPVLCPNGNTIESNCTITHTATTVVNVSGSNANPSAQAQSVASPQAVFNRTMKVGMTGEDIKTLQQILVELKLLNTNITGYFGPKTLNAVKEFQKINNLVQDGAVGTQTVDKIQISVPQETKIEQGETQSATTSVSNSTN